MSSEYSMCFVFSVGFVVIRFPFFLNDSNTV
jgi:hypothetical protein